ncbi:hypothetical protein Thal_0043 [Thermocrinis albus DSM 14484]|uniref:Uncharacterized protein n=1 Tax=Thermocrinis albus (strain DSM 14484 / JCM 11386 / HI 11/12) TaxID=638303 RepID=D3SNE4_THEAH|nr:hypothetical protein [Thermocrinis albus]ADC88681.1 hypothetical protein Thal_0043 [Thermocrinis albus DSM 14484]
MKLFKVVIYNIQNEEELITKLIELGVKPHEVYQQLLQETSEVVVQIKAQSRDIIEENLSGICQFRIEELPEHIGRMPMARLVVLWLDTTLLYLLLRYSIMSEDFRQLLYNILQVSSIASFVNLILSLATIVAYYYSFVFYTEKTPASYLLKLSLPRNFYTVLGMSLPLPSLYVMSLSVGLLKFLGLVGILLAFLLVLQGEDNVKRT